MSDGELGLEEGEKSPTTRPQGRPLRFHQAKLDHLRRKGGNVFATGKGGLTKL